MRETEGRYYFRKGEIWAETEEQSVWVLGVKLAAVWVKDIPTLMERKNNSSQIGAWLLRRREQ